MLTAEAKQVAASRRAVKYRTDPEFRKRVLAQGRKCYRSVGALKRRAANREKINAYHRRRNADPNVKPKLIENARRYAERYRIGRLVSHAGYRCKKNGIEFDAEYMAKFKNERPHHCACCGKILNYAYSGNLGRPPEDGPSLDRINPTKGYVVDNVAIICWRCNALKRDALLNELELIVSYMRERL